MSLSTFTQNNLPDEARRPPHFFLTGKIRLLGLDLDRAIIQITQKGMLFDVDQQVSPLVNVDLHGLFNGPSSMNIGGNIKVGIDSNLDLGPLGHIQARFDVHTALTAGVQGNSPFARLQGGFAFEKWNFDLPTITLALDGQELGHIVEVLTKQAVLLITHDLLRDVGKWLDLVRQGLIQGIKDAEQVARVLRNTFRLAEKAVVQELHNIGKLVNDISKALKTVFGSSVHEVAALLKDVLHLGSDAVNSALKAVGYAANDIEQALSNAFDWNKSDLNPSNWHISL